MFPPKTILQHAFSRQQSPRSEETNGDVGEAIAAEMAGGMEENLDQKFVCMDAELRPYAQQQTSIPPLSLENLHFVRQGVKTFNRQPLGNPDFDVAVEKRTIKGPLDAPDVNIYLINTTPGANKPVIVHTHGGGFVIGEALDDVPDLKFFAAELDCAIVTVDFRIAPEATFEQSIEENYTALRWVHENAAQIGVDPKRIAIMGESGGGGHAALLALTARDRGEVPVILQVLVYPMLDDRTGSTRHPPFPIGSVTWLAESNRFAWRSFLGQEPGTDNVPERAVPARYSDLGGLPPTFIAVGQTDLFVEENLDYARRLINAAVPTELHVFPCAYHGFDYIAPQSRIAKDFLSARLAALRRAFAA
jgi:acetyl esterase/lipase